MPSGHWMVVMVAARSALELGQIETAKLQSGPPDAVVVVADAELVVELPVELVKEADEVVVTGLIGQVGSLITTLVVPTILHTEVRLPSRIPAWTC